MQNDKQAINVPHSEIFLDWADEQERLLKSEQRLSEQELITLFLPEIQTDIAPTKLQELAETRKELVEYIECRLTIIAQANDETERLIRREVLKYFWGNELVDVDAQIARFNRILHFGKAIKSSRNSVTDEQIQTARSFPIEEIIIDRDLRRSGTTLKCLCPIHEEKTPSFAIYPNTNSFYCFGCSVGGDSIDLVRKLYGYEFSEAVRCLTY